MENSLSTRGGALFEDNGALARLQRWFDADYPGGLNFQPAELRCTASNQSQCLTSEQIEAVEKIYRGPVTSKGEQVAMPSALRGSEPTWPLFLNLKTAVDHPE